MSKLACSLQPSYDVINTSEGNFNKLHVEHGEAEQKRNNVRLFVDIFWKCVKTVLCFLIKYSYFSGCFGRYNSNKAHTEREDILFAVGAVFQTCQDI